MFSSAPNLADVVYPTGEGEPLAKTFAQCAAAMITAQILNWQKGNPIDLLAKSSQAGAEEW